MSIFRIGAVVVLEQFTLPVVGSFDLHATVSVKCVVQQLINCGTGRSRLVGWHGTHSKETAFVTVSFRIFDLTADTVLHGFCVAVA